MAMAEELVPKYTLSFQLSSIGEKKFLDVAPNCSPQKSTGILSDTSKSWEQAVAVVLDRKYWIADPKFEIEFMLFGINPAGNSQTFDKINCQKELESLQSQLTHFQSENKSLKQSLDTSDLDISLLEAKLKRSEIETLTLENELKSAQKHVQEWESETIFKTIPIIDESLQAKSAALQEQLKQVQKELEHIQSENKKLMQRIQWLEIEVSVSSLFSEFVEETQHLLAHNHSLTCGKTLVASKDSHKQSTFQVRNDHFCLDARDQEKQLSDHNSFVVIVDKLIKQHYKRKSFGPFSKCKTYFSDSCSIS